MTLAELASSLALRPRSGVAITEGGLVVGVQLSGGQAAQLPKAEDAGVDRSDSTAAWRHVNSAAFLDLTLRRLLEWLQHTGSDLSRCQPPSSGHCSNAGPVICMYTYIYTWLLMCRRARMLVGSR